MAFSNLIITLVGLGSVAYLMRHDVRSGGAMLKRNMRTIKSWLEEEGGKASVGCALARVSLSAGKWLCSAPRRAAAASFVSPSAACAQEPAQADGGAQEAGGRRQPAVRREAHAWSRTVQQQPPRSRRRETRSRAWGVMNSGS